MLQKTPLLILFALLWTLPLTGQDIHFSQSHFSPLNVSPGFAGVFPEDIRIMGSYRTQWQSVPVSYLTFSGAADMKFPDLLRLGKKISLAGGAIFNYDKAGDSEMTLSTFGVVSALHYQINDQNLISFGVEFSASQRSFSLDYLQFNNQFNGDIFDPSKDSKENFKNENNLFTNVSTGVSWLLQKEKSRSFATLGLGVYHLNQPLQSFNLDKNSKLPMRIAIYSGGTIEVHPKWDVIVHVLGQLQGPYKQVFIGVASRYHLNLKKGKETAIQLGTSTRLGDAIIPTFEFHYASWKIGMSYDINISDFKTATNSNGGFELGIIYTIKNVKPVKVFESCPVF